MRPMRPMRLPGPVMGLLISGINRMNPSQGDRTDILPLSPFGIFFILYSRPNVMPQSGGTARNTLTNRCRVLICKDCEVDHASVCTSPLSGGCVPFAFRCHYHVACFYSPSVHGAGAADPR